MKLTSALQVLLLAMFSLALSSCGGSSKAPAPTIPFVSGLYQLNQSTPANPSLLFTAEGSLIQSGNTISGVMHLNIGTCFSFLTDVPVTGTLSDTVNLTMALPTGQKMTLNLTHSNGQVSALAGNYTISGAGCVGSDPGISGGQQTNFSGPWQGTLTSSTGVISQINLAFTQGGPDAHGFFSGTGTATITGGTCFSGASVDPATAIIGTSSSIALDNSQPGTSGKTILAGPISPHTLGGSVFIGSYTSTQGTCSETGTFNMRNLTNPSP